jgi:outer membrane protein assembly factor BamC
MTIKYYLAGVLMASVLSGCSSVEERELASGSFEYIKEQPGQQIKIPEDIDSPNFSETYQLPGLGKDAQQDTLGKDLSILSPPLVLPIVSGSHLDEGSKRALVWFDQIDDNQPLDSTIWNSLINFLQSQGIGVKTFNKEEQRLVSDWTVMNESDNASWYSWSESQRSVGSRFEFSMAIKPHGRTASLSVELVDYKEQLTLEGPETYQAKDERREEVDILNMVVEHYEFEVKLADAKRVRQIRQGLAMELGFDDSGAPAFVVDAGYDIAWPRLLLVLRKLGFDVKDYDKSTGLLFVKYNGAESGWWSNIWADNGDALDLATEEYRFRIGDLGKKTSVTLLNDESEPFEVNKLTDLYQTFSQTMAADDLDI